MAAPLKAFFDAALVRAIGDQLAAADADFPRAQFESEATAGLDALELLGRGDHIAAAMARALPTDRARALKVLVASLGPPLGEPGLVGMAPFHYLPHSAFIAAHGLEHPEGSLDALHALTRRFTAEFALRAFVEAHPERTFDRLAAWVTDPDPHVRRLVSEGTRPRLPWAARLRALQADPTPMLPLLEQLRDDPSEYVRRSVANHLNDIGKDHPELLLKVATAWWDDAPPARRALLRHALRDRIKKGDRAAIALLGAGGGTFAVRGALPARADLGGKLPVTVFVTNTGDAPARAVVDLVVGFPGAGRDRRKVFKLRVVDLVPGETATLRKSISLAEHTTRAARAGPHTFAVQLDGAASPLGVVDVA